VAEPPSGHIRSLDKGMEIIELLAAEPRGLSVAEIARQLGFNVSTTHHLVATLRRRGFLDQDPETRAYRLGYRLVSVVNEFVSGADIYAVGAGPIRDLRDASGDTAYLTATSSSSSRLPASIRCRPGGRARRGRWCCTGSPPGRRSSRICPTSNAAP
jgi:DNA-binding IclR family transcriptional regulator